MYKILLYVLISVLCMQVLAIQIDEERALHTVFFLKHGLNRALHAAAQQLDEDLLAQGIPAIDEEAAEEAAYRYLRENLRLSESLEPLPGSFLQSPVEVLAFDIINIDRVFPYRYSNGEHDFEATLHRPGVVMIIGAEYPRVFRLIKPIRWEIKGTAELYAPLGE